MKRLLKIIGIVVGAYLVIALVIHFTYELACLITSLLGIKDMIIPGTMVSMDMRGDIKMFLCLVIIELLFVVYILSIYSESKEKQKMASDLNTKKIQSPEERQRLLDKKLESIFDRRYPSTNKINIEAKRIAKLLIQEKTSNLSYLDTIYSNINKKFTTEDEVHILQRVTTYISIFGYSIENKPNFEIKKIY